jgi:hypothetical protein
MSEMNTIASVKVDESEFDLEEYKALRQEILLRIDTTFRTEVWAITGAAAVYAWVAAKSGAVDPAIWLIPVACSAVGWLREESLGKQVYRAGNYLLALEKRRRPEEMIGLRDDAADDPVHGWEGYIRLRKIRRSYVDHASRLFWVIFLVLSATLAIRGYATH